MRSDERRAPCRPIVTALAVAALFGVLCVGGAEGAALKDLVPDYMDGDLETAIIPAPQEAKLKDTAFAAGTVAVMKPAGYKAPDTLVEELGKLLGADAVSVEAAADPAKAAADTVILVGKLNALDAWKKLKNMNPDYPNLDQLISTTKEKARNR